MAGKKKHKGEVIPMIKTDDIVVVESTAFKDVFPHDDPRSGMSKEQMLEFERKEQEELDRRMNRFIKDAPKPDTRGIEDDEEQEVFTLDLANNKIVQKVEDTLVVTEGQGNLATLVADVILPPVAPVNPYTDLITDVITAKALERIYKDLQKAWEGLQEHRWGMPTKESGDLMQQTLDKLEKQLDELRRAWIRGTNKVNYDKIPEWAEKKIKDHIAYMMTDLLSLTGEA